VASTATNSNSGLQGGDTTFISILCIKKNDWGGEKKTQKKENYKKKNGKTKKTVKDDTLFSPVKANSGGKSRDFPTTGTKERKVQSK